MPETTWTQVVIGVDPDAVELVADRLWSFVPAAIEELPQQDQIQLIAGYRTRAAAVAAADLLRAEGWASAEIRTVDDGGLDGWRAHATAQRAGPFLVVPAWHADQGPVPDTMLLRIDPGHSFGSASHPTTRLVLAALSKLSASPGCPPTVLDVGCGSGILSVAAALLGASHVRGIDIDPGAPAVTAANALRNGVASAVEASTVDLAAIAESGLTYVLVLANLLAPVVVDLAQSLATVVADGGQLVVSGLLADRWRDTTAHLTDFDVIAVTTEDGWAAITLRRR